MNRLLIVEDDATFAAGLVRTFSRRGYACALAATCADALAVAATQQPSHVLLDLHLGTEDTQDLVPQLRRTLPKAVIVMLTGVGTIPSTVRAMKDGANHYLCKPAPVDAIARALEESTDVAAEPVPLWDLENDHIVRILEECGGNISQAAKTLGLHRRTLQRRLRKIDSAD